MLRYNPNLKTTARSLRANLTDAKQRLWSRLRRKQVVSVQFYRQKPIGNYIVDFYAPAACLVVEEEGIRRNSVIFEGVERVIIPLLKKGE